MHTRLGRNLTAWLQPAWSSQVPRAGAVAGVIRMSGRFAALLLQLLAVRIVVSQEAFSLYAWGQNLLFLLGGVFALGIPVAASRLVAVHFHSGNTAARQGVIHRARGMLALFSFGAAALGLLLLTFLPGEELLGPANEVLLVVLLAAPLVSFTMLNQAIARAQSQLVSAFLPTQVLRPVTTACVALVILVMADARLSAVQMLTAVLGSLLIVLLIQWVFGKAPAPSEGTGDAVKVPEDYEARRLMSNALPVFATRLSELVVKHSSVLVLGIMTSPLLVGEFFVAERVAQLAMLPMLVVSAVIQPWLASAHAGDNQSRLQQVVSQAVHTILWPTVAAAVAVAALSGVLLGLFGDNYAEATPVLLILVLSHLVAALLGPNAQILLMSGHQATFFRISAGAAALHLAMLVALAPIFGGLGAALATLLSTITSGVLALSTVRRKLALRSSILLGAGMRRA